MAKVSVIDWGGYECVTPLASGGGGDVWLARRLGERDCGLVLKHTRPGEPAELAALRRHGVAGVNNEVEDGGFQLMGVGVDAPQTARQHDLGLNGLAKGAAQKVGHS